MATAKCKTSVYVLTVVMGRAWALYQLIQKNINFTKPWILPKIHLPKLIGLKYLKKEQKYVPRI